MRILIGTNTPNVTTTPRKGRPKDKFILKNLPKFHPDNERIKHKYFCRMAPKFDKKTLAKIVSAVWVFDEFNNFKDFKLFKYEDAHEFQKYLLKKYSHSMQMANRTITYVKEFFMWLREHDGYKKLTYDDVDALELSFKDREKGKMSKPRDYLDAEKWQDLEEKNHLLKQDLDYYKNRG